MSGRLPVVLRPFGSPPRFHQQACCTVFHSFATGLYQHASAVLPPTRLLQVQRLLEEYYKLDYEDVVGGVRTRFR